MSRQVVDHKGQKIKCVVWDLDNTIWDGVLLEDERVSIREPVVDLIKALDSRGILQSVASKNEYNSAMAKIDEFGLKEFFLYPQIHWGSKAASMKSIAQSINIGMDTLAFIDDQPFELEEVSFMHPEVLCIDAASMDSVLDMPEMNPRFITDDAKNRRLMYLSDIERQQYEEGFAGPKEEFLASLDMFFSIRPAAEGDLERAEELTVRTHQLNTTGDTYSFDELSEMRRSDDHLLLVASLKDKYGSYGTIGLALVEVGKDVWRIKLLLMSCRVMSRGVGSIMLNQIMRAARDAGAVLEAEFVPTDKNRMMYITYKFANFKEKEEISGRVLLENRLTKIIDEPNYIKVEAELR
jgi:FkbH-like protein